MTHEVLLLQSQSLMLLKKVKLILSYVFCPLKVLV